MTMQAIVLKDGAVISGALVEHLGSGRVIIAHNGTRIAGEKMESWQRKQLRNGLKGK